MWMMSYPVIWLPLITPAQISFSSLKGYLGNWPHYYRVVHSKLMFYNINNFHQQHSHKTEKFENHLLFRNNFLPNLRLRAQFSKHLVSFMQFSEQFGEPYTVPARPSPFSSRQISWHVRLHALPRQRNGAPLLNLGAICSVYDQHKKIYDAVN
jgi:hypothetical protein